MLVSVGMAGIVVFAILINGTDTFTKFFQRKELVALTLFFWIVVFSGFYSADKPNWLNWVRIKLPFALLPLAFAAIEKPDSRKFIILLYSFMLVFFVSSCVIIGYYFLHFQTITESFYKGQAIPVKYGHIRYSLMLAFSFFCSSYLLSTGSFLWSKRERWLQAGYLIFAFIVLHILSVRSGLIALYLGLFYLAVYQLIVNKKIILGLALTFALAATPMAAYYAVPSFHNKLLYMLYDLGSYADGNINENSDGLRLLSMKVGIEVWKQNKLLGVGAGDLQAETAKIYDRDYPQINPAIRRLPHNQFIWVLATTGVVGLGLFLFAFLFPLFLNGSYKYWLIAIFHIMLFSSFFTEDTLEEQIGTGFYIIFLLLLLNYFKRNE